MRATLLGAGVLLGMSLASVVFGQETAGSTLSVPPGPGQRALVVGVANTPKGPRIVARTCPTADCSLTGAQAIPSQPPDESSVAQARFRVLTLSPGRRVMHLEAGAGATRWQAILAAPMASGTEPLLIWSGATPTVPSDGKPADALQVTPAATPGLSQILVGQVDPNLELCGRSTLLSPRVVHTDLTLRHVKLQRLANSERDAAERVTATRTTDAPKPLGELLVGVGASSGYGSPGALTDGDPETVWSEARGKEGRGEFLVMRAPSDVPIPSISFVVRPPRAQVEHGASPKTFYLAADGRLIRVTVPEDAWKQPGARYEARFSQPLATSCLALVLDDAFVAAQAKDARVTLAELTAHSAFDGTETLETLAEALGGEESRATAAAGVLLRAGEPAAKAVASKLGALNASGRHLAMQVLDAAPCTVSSPVFASMLASELQSERAHAQDRIQRCGRRSADALTEVVTHGAGCAPSYPDEAQCAATRSNQKRHRLDPSRLAALNELASVAPERAVPLIAPLLGDKNRPTRRALRLYLSRATKKPQGRLALSKQLLDDSLPVPAKVDLLRAVKGALGDLRGPAGVALGRVATEDATLRTRYLLLEPAGVLAAAGDGRALHFLRTRIASDPEPMVRTQAAVVARGVPALRPWLLHALEDENVRVRHAATASLAGEGEATPYLVRRLMLDDWPLVRASAARSLATTGPSELADAELGRALQNVAPSVRQWAVTSLGARGVTSMAPEIRAMADEASEKVTVRIAAVHALGMMCDANATEMLTIFADRSADPYSPEASSGLGAASVAALGRLQPSDLKKRLEVLLTREGVPVAIKSAAEAALETRDRCPR